MSKFKGNFRIESTRLKGWNYSNNGFYFLTICTHKKQKLFGQIVKGILELTDYGNIVENNWMKLEQYHKNIKLDRYIVMPDHFHGIIQINNFVVSNQNNSQSNVITDSKYHDISEIIRGFKTFSAKEINVLRNLTGNPVWQKRFYDRIIRSENELNNVRKYINENPIRWNM